MKTKYIEEKYPPYFIFGEKDGYVDIESAEGHIATVKKEDAMALITDRDSLILKLSDLAMAFYKADPDAFDMVFWKE